jgi:formamidopyrimidine-DNA glycosylase
VGRPRRPGRRRVGSVSCVPELPEVESVRRQLAPEMTGRGVVAAWRDPYPSPRIRDVHLTVGRRIDAVQRRGKFLLCPLAGEDAAGDLELVLHLGMTGGMRLVATPAGGADPDAGVDHVRVRLALDDGRTLLFRDPRRFGRATVVPAGDYAGRIPTLAELGPEPLSDAFDATRFAAALATTRAPVKARLLDQRLVAGVGNIYADEALWRARIHPASRRVGGERARRLHAAIRAVLAEAIEREGTTFRDYQLVNGASGRFAQELAAYGQAGRPCPRCATPLRRTLVGQRGTTYCPHCQRH